MNESIRTYFSRIGRKGGKAGVGKKKARTSEQARMAALRMWEIRRSENIKGKRSND